MPEREPHRPDNETRARLEDIKAQARKMLFEDPDPETRYQAYQQYIRAADKLGDAFSDREIPLAVKGKSLDREAFAAWESGRAGRELQAKEIGAAIDRRWEAESAARRDAAIAEAAKLRETLEQEEHTDPLGHAREFRIQDFLKKDEE
ncbi:hypothetical protein HYS28_01475 [Candidatus Uhrbacteria bacterium]|nr:hypothetical protein [Candidatus Uhrbacteria bacterium]